MENLERYIARANIFRKHAGRSEFDVNNLTTNDAEELFNNIDCDLSPENLTCDGELPRAEVQKRKRFYKACIAELEQAGFTKPDHGLYFI